MADAVSQKLANRRPILVKHGLDRLIHFRQHIGGFGGTVDQRIPTNRFHHFAIQLAAWNTADHVHSECLKASMKALAFLN